MIDLRYIMGRQDALAEVAVRIKSGGAESALRYCEEQVEMTRQAESEMLEDIYMENQPTNRNIKDAQNG